MDDIRVTAEESTGMVAAELIRELSTELAGRYPGLYGGDGAGAFKPQDVLVARAAFLVAWRGDEAIGCGALRPMDEVDVVEIKRMFVRPAARDNGVGRIILSALETQAREFGYRIARLETGLRNPEAIALYERAGYQRIPCYGIYVNEPLSVCFEMMLY